MGLIDVSGKVGIERHTSDFGQTFGVWGVGAGPIVELPFFGTSNSRDATGKVLSFFVAPLGDSDTVSTLSTVNTVAKTVDGRAMVLPLTTVCKSFPTTTALCVIPSPKAALTMARKANSALPALIRNSVRRVLGMISNSAPEPVASLIVHSDIRRCDQALQISESSLELSPDHSTLRVRHYDEYMDVERYRWSERTYNVPVSLFFEWLKAHGESAISMG